MTEKTTLASAMALAFGEIDAATKSAANPHLRSKYADLSSVIGAIKPALVKNGLFFTQHPEPVQGGVQIETILHHTGGEHLAMGSLFVPANKNDAQGYGSALTYARRYALVTAFGVPTEDDDGHAASKAPPKEAKPAKPEAAPEFISSDDVALAIQLCEAVGGSQAQEICKAYKIKTLSQLTQKQGVAVIDRLQGKLADRAKEETNAMGEA